MKQDIKLQKLELLKADALSCVACRLYSSRTNVVFGSGSSTAKIFFIGEGPGQEEDLRGEPFVGRSGKLLTLLIEEELGVKREECYIANVVKCRPPENRNPLKDEVLSCNHFLSSQLDLVQPRVIVTLGNTATKAVLNVKDGIVKVRQKTYEFNGFKVVPTFHPAAALRTGGMLIAQMRSDFIRAKKIMNSV